MGMGLRYLPELAIVAGAGRGWTADAELTANTFAWWYPLAPEAEGEVKLYRAWVRLSRSQWELRAGLQKISFGSATLLRPLMWFDRLDPTEPLQLAEGVTGLLGRWYSVHNASLWAWVLYGNRAPTGWETLPSARRKPELGGRLQLPVPKGEVGFTGHYRTAEQESFRRASPHQRGPEYRLGVDGKWDLGIGLWVEGTFVRRDLPHPLLKERNMGAVGADYTFGLGNGLHVLGETLWMDSGAGSNAVTLSAVSLSYPLSMVDMISTVVFLDWREHAFYRFASWRRTLDRWQVHLMVFWNPEDRLIYQTTPGTAQLAGIGWQLLVVFNH